MRRRKNELERRNTFAGKTITESFQLLLYVLEHLSDDRNYTYTRPAGHVLNYCLRYFPGKIKDLCVAFVNSEKVSDTFSYRSLEYFEDVLMALPNDRLSKALVEDCLTLLPFGSLHEANISRVVPLMYIEQFACNPKALDDYPNFVDQTMGLSTLLRHYKSALSREKISLTESALLAAKEHSKRRVPLSYMALIPD